ncbi:MAG: carbohydrate-binding domain-containing protein [Fibromonadaceae bacterium]|nr:carbohydrate-binding domain-containing protein [Fibromonadaceae bacterium]
MLFIATALITACSSETNNSYAECEAGYEYLDNSISIAFGDGGPVVDNPYENDVAIMLSGENVIVQFVQNISSGAEYNLLVSGTTENGSLKIYGNHAMGLYLNGVNITNPSGPAINIQNRSRVLVHLVRGTENYLADSTPYEVTSSEDAKGTFFSKGPVHFSGCGSLAITARHAHAIAVDNDWLIEGGNITVKTTKTKSHGISSNASTTISGNSNIKIEASGNGSKGIKSDGPVSIQGGTIDIKTSGITHIDYSANPPDTSSATGIKTDSDMAISGGVLTVKASGTGAKGINVNLDLMIIGGETKVEANDDGVKVNGNLHISDGSLCAWSLNKQDIDSRGAEAVKSGSVNGRKCVVGF